MRQGTGWRCAAALVLTASCSRANPLFGAEGEAETDTAALSESATTPSAETTANGSGNSTAPTSNEPTGGSGQTDSFLTGTSSGSSSSGETGDGIATTTNGQLCPEWQGPCELFGDGCAGGSKCVPVGDPGADGAFDGAQCVPAGPGAEDQPCIEECGPRGGADDCGLGMTCLFGACVAFCPRTDETCPDLRSCTPDFHGAADFGFCLHRCDPLLNDCEEGFVCVPDPALAWVCVHGTPPGGGQGAPCMGIAACDPGFACWDGNSVSGCATARCCTAACGNTSDCSGSDTCTNLGSLVPLYENVGVCTET